MANYSKSKKYHFTYKTVNLINGRYYLGMHSTNRLDDGYLGSGKRLYYELNKYGRDNFKLEILKQFNSREELVQAEVELITEEYLNDSNCLNIKPGGSGGFSKEAAQKGQRAGVLVRLEKFKKNKEYKEAISKQKKELYNETLGKWIKEVGHKTNPFKGKRHTKETIENMKNHTRQTGSKNSQYGRPRSEETKQKIRESLKKTLEEKKSNI